MSDYRVLGPVAFTRDGAGVTCMRVGAVVDCPDEQAEALVAGGLLEPVRGSKSTAKN